MVVATNPQYDRAKGVGPSVYEWAFTNQHGNNQLEFITSREEAYEQQFNVPFDSVVDESAIFRTLAEQWRRERGSTSSITEMVTHPAYQSIIGLGPRAIRFIIAELRAEGDEPDHWFWALQSMTRENPVLEEHEGNLREMARAWLSWAASEGYAG